MEQHGLDGCMLPIVLLPGMHGTGELLADLVGQLEQRRSVHVITYPEQEALGYAALIPLVRQRLPDGPCVILGELFSGPIAIALAATLPQVAGLILAVSFARRPVVAAVAPYARLFDPRWLPRSVINAALFGSTGTLDQRTQLHRILARLGRRALQARGVDAARVDTLAELAAVKCPILYLQGLRDRLIPRRCLDEIVRVRPGAKIAQVDAAHMLLCTHAVEAAALIDRFCDAVGDARVR